MDLAVTRGTGHQNANVGIAPTGQYQAAVNHYSFWRPSWSADSTRSGTLSSMGARLTSKLDMAPRPTSLSRSSLVICATAWSISLLDEISITPGHEWPQLSQVNEHLPGSQQVLQIAQAMCHVLGVFSSVIQENGRLSIGSVHDGHSVIVIKATTLLQVRAGILESDASTASQPIAQALFLFCANSRSFAAN